ncbi:BrnA antitoxin family protein [Flaviflagellibacter deserti]|uniref:BrnA antitoxin family protein n=1 Tax=Flaviflagellibacter deserti TaxID=2267266 RepID=A0ABV9Z4C1_9HYPH
MKKKGKKKNDAGAAVVDAASPSSAADSAEAKALYKPVKQSVTIRLDSDVVAWFKSREDRYQTAINKVLRKHMLKRLSDKKKSAPAE